MPSAESTEKASSAFGGFVLDAQRRGLYRGDERVHLTPIPFKVLEFLVQHQGSVVSKEQLLVAVWGGQREENTVEQAIRQIRRALGEDREEPRFIQTIPGVGYCFIAETAVIGGEPREKLDVPSSTESDVSTGRPEVRAHRATIIASLTIGIAVCAFVITMVALQLPSARLSATTPVRLDQSRALILSPLLSDGVKIYYPRYENGQYSVAATPIEGGTDVVIPTGLPNPELCDLTPDGSRMLLRDLARSRDSDNPLYVLNKGGKARRVGNIQAYDAAWFPGGKRILYSAKGVVYSTNIAGSTSHRLFSVPGNAYWFRWSPNGRELRFTVLNRKNERLSLWQVDAGSDHPRQLFTRLGHYVCCGTWTPDGRFYLFQVRNGNSYQIWVQPTTRGSIFPLHNRPYPLVFGAVSYRSPLVSKNGKRLFLRDSEPRGELMRNDPQLGEFIPLLPSIPVHTLNFSRNGHWIAYTSSTDNNLWRCRSNGTQCIPLTQTLRYTLMPRWSPDGRMITFMGLTFQSDWRIYVVSADGGHARAVFKGSQAEGYPDWSPDGKHLAFSEVVPVARPDGIHILDLHTGKVSTLPGSTNFYLPRWSPNGRYLVALHSGNHFLYLYNFATKSWQPLAKMRVGYPNWSHDGKEVYFESIVSGSRIAYRVGLENHVVDKVASLAGVDPSPSIMGDWMGLGPNDSILTVQNMSTDNIYEWSLAAR
jgi:Tol biopolymer transport system component/DNA-binding winged helix-turn-helix (wHTH) protein